MAQTGYTPISLYYSTTASQAPTAGNLANGELAINITDGKLYYKDNTGAVKVIAGSGGTGIVAGSNTQIQFNNNGVFGASSGMTWDGTNLTASQLRSSGLTSGRVTYASTSGLLVDSANMTFNGTVLTVNTLSLTNALSTANGGTGVTSFTVNRVFYASSTSALGQSANLTFDGTTLVAANFTDSSLTSGRVTYATTGGNLTDSANLLYSGTDLTVYGITVGRGGGAVSSNTAVGAGAMAGTNTGTGNVGVGNMALAANTAGDNNTAVGNSALTANTTAQYNTALGSAALYTNTTGGSNTAVGRAALFSATTASNNTAVGYEAGASATTSPSNVFVGYQAGRQGGAGASTFVGYRAGYTTGSGSNNTAFGYEALLLNSAGVYNVMVGLQAGRATTSSTNTAVGYQSLLANTTGGDHTAVGGFALQANTTGSSNVAIGQSALQANTTASNNTAVGYQAGYAATVGGYSTFVGYQSGLASNFTSDAFANNTFVGALSGSTVTTGRKNTILGLYNGNQGGLDIRIANNYIVLSDGDGNPRQGIDGNGNIFYGTTPAAWGSAWRAMQLGTQASWYTNNDFTRFALNVYGDSVYTERYLQTDHASQYIQASGNHTFMGADSGTAGDAITWTTMLNFKKDNTVALQGASFVSGTGITFPAAQSASSNANTLDDYEEGSWTPGITNGASYSTQVGRYVKIGNLVYVNADIVCTFTNTGAGNQKITGLPFAIENVTAMYPVGTIFPVQGFNQSTMNISTQGDVNATTVTLYTSTPSTGVNYAFVAPTTFGTTVEFEFSMVYRTAT